MIDLHVNQCKQFVSLVSTAEKQFTFWLHLVIVEEEEPSAEEFSLCMFS